MTRLHLTQYTVLFPISPPLVDMILIKERADHHKMSRVDHVNVIS